MADPIEQGAVLVLDEIIRRAVRAKASDVHLEPKRDRLNVRFRVDGEMVEEQSVPLDIASMPCARSGRIVLLSGLSGRPDRPSIVGMLGP